MDGSRIDRSSNSVPRIAVVGGGPGGLFTAYRLQHRSDQPYRLTLFEASPRLGGKIETASFESAPVTYEKGAAELYDNSPVDEDPLRDLVAELGLSVTAMAGESVVVRDRFVANLDDVETDFGAEARAALLRFDREARGLMTPQQFYDSDQAESFDEEERDRRFEQLFENVASTSAREYLLQMMHSDLATEPKRTNLRYGLQNYLMNSGDYMSLYTIDGGNEELPRAIAERLHAEVRLKHAVQSVATVQNGRLRLSIDHGGSQTEEEFDHVILALPHLALERMHFPQAELHRQIQSHLEHYDHPAHYLRITMLFDKPFWRGILNDSFCMLDHFGGCCLYDESSRVPDSKDGVLGWLLGGEDAVSMADWDDEKLVAAMLDALPSPLALARDHFLEGTVCRWLGAVNAMPGGTRVQGFDRRHLPAPQLAPELFVVGDYLFDSTLNGVLESAEYVASSLACRMTEAASRRRSEAS